MRCDDFVCLGRTVPEESKKYGHKVCMAGYSEELGSLMRVYPLPIVNPIHARRICVLELERNPSDSRVESWKLRERERSIVAVSDRDVPSASIIGFLRNRSSSSIEELNDRRMSLGVLEPRGECRGMFVERSGVAHPDQGMLFDVLDDQFGANAIDLAPYLQFHDATGRPHQLQLREWGCYEFLRKHRQQAADLWNALHLHDDRRTLLLVGNMANSRNVWLIIKVFKAERQEQLTLAGLCTGETV